MLQLLLRIQLGLDVTVGMVWYYTFRNRCLLVTSPIATGTGAFPWDSHKNPIPMDKPGHHNP